MKKIIFIAIALVAVVSCAKQEDNLGGATTTEAQEVKFTSGIVSRTSGNEWEAGDRIGIYTVDGNASGESMRDVNVQYVADFGGSSTTFSIAEGAKPICLPESSPVQLMLMAYYPYDADHSVDNTYTMEITDQTDLGAIDYMCANAFILEDGISTVNFDLEHMQALAKFNITGSDTVPSLEGLSFKLENIQTSGVPSEAPSPASDGYELAQYGTIDSAVVNVADDMQSAAVEMILFPASTTYPTDATIYISVDGNIYSAPLVTSLLFGKQHTFNITLGADKAEISGAIITDWGNIDGGELEVEEVE